MQPEQGSEFDELMMDKEAFENYLYTHWEDAVEELRKRKDDAKLQAYVDSLLPNGVPPAMEAGDCMGLFRHFATSNYEVRRFLIVADSLAHLKPLLLGYSADKFNDRNEWKHMAGKLCFFKGCNKKREWLFESENIINFNTSHNLPLTEVPTLWGESLVEFHRRLFLKNYPQHEDAIQDLSIWLRSFGPTAKDYYKPFFALFLRHGILFENFLPTSAKESGFTRDVILPAFRELERESGYRPLIVTLDPSSLEGHKFWLSHPIQDRAFLEEASGQGKPLP
jgi:hypothetical protein